MTNFDALINSYERYRESLVTANERNKSVVFDALTAVGVTTVRVEFDGEGDQGQIEAVTACVGEAHATLPATPVPLHRASFQQGTITTAERRLTEAVEVLCYDYLQQEHGGWENNEGGFGAFEFDVAKRTIQLEFNGRYTEVATHNHDF